MQDRVRLSKFLSLVLRHQPERIGLALDAAGWASIDDLVARSTAAGVAITRDIVLEIATGGDKPRFAISADGVSIRATHGHSHPGVAVRDQPAEPPEILYHGTATRFLEAILRDGLRAGARHFVHLSPDPDLARSVGRRHGAPVVLTVAAGRMHRDGLAFYCADAATWLTAAVPRLYLSTAGAID